MATKKLKFFAFFIILSMTNSLVAMASLDPILAPSPNDDEIVECWSSLERLNKCVNGIYKVFLGIGMLDSPCCKVINGIDSKCWQKLFPFDPSFGDILVFYCSISAPSPSPLAAI
ncbi:hypothetical protein R3W88_032703 [Solanum pinnatisectum]|uniref:Prolamin-like domain-containing protein n=1 Tax=Solanum pinnatisectum TaxID=50273 RepID=A0AAV9LPZ8_9SOLN|nr:hypothetical protein R3W88_032703 [Solanum pinnatisectum]